MSVYDELLTELETLAKAMPEADENLEEEGKAHAEPDADDEGGPSDGDEDNEDKPMAKSMSVTLPDGTEAEAVDGMELIKSLQTQFQSQMDVMTEGSGKVLKVMSVHLKEQAELIKSLKSDIDSLRSEGRGRKTVVTMAGADPEPMAKSMAVTPSEVLSKCLDAQKAGKLTALDVSMAEGYLNRGMQIPDRIVSAIS
jgi:hypothetical protein